MSEKKLPKTYQAFVARFPELGEAHETIAQSVQDCGPLDEKTCSLVKIGISLGAGLESAVRSHVRRPLKPGHPKSRSSRP